MVDSISLRVAIQQLNQKVKALGLPELDEILPDGEIHRFGPKQVGWYCLEDDDYCLFGHFGNHKHNNGDTKNSQYFEYPYVESITKEEKEAATKQREALAQQHEKREREKHANAEKEAQRL